jgi:flavodoxin
LTTTKPLIIYYSKTGTTAKIAEITKIIINAESRRLKEPLTFIERIIAKRRSVKDGKSTNWVVKEFDPIILLTPIWNGKPSPAIEQFIDSVNLKGKRVIFGLVGANQTNLQALDKLRQKAARKGSSFLDDIYLKGVKPGQTWSDLKEEDYVREANRLAKKVYASLEFPR